jgi:hypothetical protein
MIRILSKIIAGAALALFFAGCGKEEKAVALASIKVVPAQVKLAVGGMQPLTAVSAPKDAGDVAFVWSSADKTVATVSDKGVVTGVAAGNTTVKVAGGGIEKSVPVQVVAGYGSLNITANWDDRYAGVDIPFSYKVTAGDFAGTAFEATFTPDYLFDPGELTVIACSPAAGITVEGNTATLASADGLFNTAPGWFFSGAQTLTVVKDADNPVTLDMHQQVGLLTVELPALPLVTSMSATLGGVATQINLETGAITGDAGTVAFGFTPTGSAYTATVRLLGTTGNTQPLTLTLNYPDNSSGQITTDLNTVLAGFNANKKTPFSPVISLPVIFAPQVSSAIVHAGNRKVEIEVRVDDPGITTAQVYGSDYRHFADIAINNQTGVFRTVINNLEEGDCTFRIYSTDSDGNKSLPVEVQGEAFGENRISQLRNRSITVAILSGSTGITTINWGDPEENSTGCTLTYTDTGNGQKTITAPSDATVTTIDDFKSGLRYATQFELGSGNVAETFSVDEAPQTVFKNLDDKSAWSAEASSYHDAPRMASAAIDGNPWQPWHSSAGGQSMPQWIIIDFGDGNALPIDGIVYQARIDDIGDRGFPKTVQWESSNDKTAWTPILSSENLEYPAVKPAQGQEKPLWLPCTAKTTARYLRATISETWPTSRVYTYIGELGIFQTVE